MPVGPGVGVAGAIVGVGATGVAVGVSVGKGFEVGVTTGPPPPLPPEQPSASFSFNVKEKVAMPSYRVPLMTVGVTWVPWRVRPPPEPKKISPSERASPETTEPFT